jgi:hypothetical protein
MTTITMPSSLAGFPSKHPHQEFGLGSMSMPTATEGGSTNKQKRDLSQMGEFSRLTSMPEARVYAVDFVS